MNDFLLYLLQFYLKSTHTHFHLDGSNLSGSDPFQDGVFHKVLFNVDTKKQMEKIEMLSQLKVMKNASFFGDIEFEGLQPKIKFAGPATIELGEENKKPFQISWKQNFEYVSSSINRRTYLPRFTTYEYHRLAQLEVSEGLPFQQRCRRQRLDHRIERGLASLAARRVDGTPLLGREDAAVAVLEGDVRQAEGVAAPAARAVSDVPHKMNVTCVAHVM